MVCEYSQVYCAHLKPYPSFQIVDMSTGKAHTMNLTELAGSKERWLGIHDLFDGGQWKNLSPFDIVALNTDMGDQNMPIDKTGFLQKHKFEPDQFQFESASHCSQSQLQY